MSAESAASIEWRKIGKITGVHGLKGELYVYVFSKDISWTNKLDTLLLEDAKGERSEHRIQNLRAFKDGFLVVLEGVLDRTAAENLRSRLVYVSSHLFVSEEGEDSFYLLEIEGFKVFDKGLYIGIIESFSSNTVQDLLVVALENGSKAEIPLVEPFITDIRFEEGEVHMDLPPGLIEVQQVTKK